MLLTLITALILLPPLADLDNRTLAAEELEGALERSNRETGAGRSALPALDAGIEVASETLGPDSELAHELARLARGARFEGFLAGNDGAAWLADRLVGVVSDLRFEPVREAERPAGFPDYTPVGEIRVQRYPTYRMARTTSGHIQENGIAMTAPVETTFDASEPVLSESSMAFLYASQSLGSTGTRGPVEVLDVSAHSAVSIGLRGVERPRRIEDARQKLELWIAEHPRWRSAGPLRIMGYNSPMVRADRRYFEVQIPVKQRGSIVIDFSAAEEAPRWRAVDDVVMGGRSSSRMEATPEGTCVFTGELSLENNGGFASVRRAAEQVALAGASSVVLRVRGDGKTYRLRFRTKGGYDVPSYQADFETVAGEWIDVTLDLVDFELKWRGRAVPDAPLLDPSAVHGLGLLIADEQVGSFRLELASLSRP
jgi:monofunctional biosynthetic peptidoglycan transglycosylase